MILAAIDQSDRAALVIEEAIELAEAFDEEVHAVHVMSRSEFVERQRDAVDEEGRGIEPEKIRSLAADVARDVLPDGSPHEAVGLVGKPAEEIVSYADENGAQYVVVSSRKRSPTGKALFGSVVQSVLLNTNRPVVSIVD